MDATTMSQCFSTLAALIPEARALVKHQRRVHGIPAIAIKIENEYFNQHGL